jgi:hypothetical protein
MPYINKYEQCLKEKNIKYDIVFFDRDSTRKEITQNGNEITYYHTTTTSRIRKILPVFRYINFVKKLIRKNKYDKLIVMTTMPAVLLKSLLLGKYQGKYIYDYRDTTYEHFSFFKKMVDKIIAHSYFTAMSSRGYLNILSNSRKIVINHNISNAADAICHADPLKEVHPITIGFLGYVRYFDVNSLLIKQFSNIPGYNLLYIGTPFSDCDLGKYAESINAKNVEILGRYDNNDKAKLYQCIKIINSMYSLNSSEVQYAIPNRVYDAALFKKPIMTTKGTHLSEIVEKYKLGFSVDPFNDDVPQKVQEYINNYNADDFLKACNDFLALVKRDESTLTNKIMDFLC